MFHSRRFLFVCFASLVLALPSFAQERNGTITGTATDAGHDVLPSAPVKLDPGNISVVTNGVGEFTITDVAPGTYTLTVTYIGFSPFTTSVTVAAGQVVKVDAVLAVAMQNEQVVVSAGRSYGEAEAVNETRAADNIVNILPAIIIQSLPNANVADAVGRLPGVTLERDEGEGKYVQIRGTAPNLSNLTIDGIVVPSPEGGVRQVKLDTIPADIIESVQINKTLQANLDADAVGGSVNLVTKSAPEFPTLSMYGAWGFTPIINNVPVTEFSGTVGQRFGRAKRLGLIVSGGYDYNGRGIDDVEPLPTLAGTPLTTAFTSAAIRQYRFDRERYGLSGTLDYKIGEASLIYVKGLYSNFADNGHRWEYVLSAGGGLPSITTERRLGNYLVSSLLLGGNHVFSKSWFDWGVAASHSRLNNPISGGESITTFVPTAAAVALGNNCQYDPAATKDTRVPQFTAACFTDPNGVGAYEPAKFQLQQIVDSAHGKSDQVNLAAFASVARNYHLGSHNSTFELGFKIRNGHKFDNSFSITHTPTGSLTEDMFLSGFRNPNYYNGDYKFAPDSASWERANAFLAANPTQFNPASSNQGSNPQNFGLVERITSGYIMNTLNFSRFRLIAGLRIEGTQESSSSFNPSTGLFGRNPDTSYVSPLPSASLRMRLDNSSDLKLVYSRALARPDPAFLAGAFQIDTGTAPPSVIVGNTALKPEHANNYDLLYERYLTPLGLVQAGFFYKDLTGPVVQTLTPVVSTVSNDPNTVCFIGGGFVAPAGQTICFLSTPSNGGSAYVTGFELAFLQHFTYLPGPLAGLGVSANYSYATSQATGISPFRDDKPALLRQAPNTWNISPTYDRGRVSIRVGLAFNDANIFQYAFRDLTPNATPPPAFVPNPPNGGLHGPSGDQYLYSHFQVDAEGSFRIRRGLYFTAAGLNLNNEVFGFYNGSAQFPIQREYYQPTYTFGMRWEPFLGR